MKNRPSQKTPWIKNAVVYQIYPLSFKDSNSDGKGDLAGIIEKLDYLEWLGITAVWLSPVFTSPMTDAGYDISDYKNISPIFGNLETLNHLIAEAHKRKIKIILDFVGNHTSSDHPWFTESRMSRENPKRNWYIWKEPKANGEPPNNWLSVFGGSAWQCDRTSGQYYLHSFLKTQPDLNWRNKEVQDEMKKILEFWIAHGVDGFRVDALYHFIEDPEYRDDPVNPDYEVGDDPYKSLLHIHSKGRAQLKEVLDVFSELLKKYPEVFFVSEAYVPTFKLVEMYEHLPNERYLPFNFNLIGLPWNASEYKKFIDDYEKRLPESATRNYVLGNHDISRVSTRVGKDSARLAAFITLTLPGTPFIYYGDEIGMKDSEIPRAKIQDTAEKLAPGFKLGRDPERTPMQWDDSKYAGFSKTEPWLPIGKNSDKNNVETLKNDKKSILALYRELIHLRNSSEILRRGKYEPRISDSLDVFSFFRIFDEEKSMVLANFSNKSVEEYLPKNCELILSSYLDKTPGEKMPAQIALRPNEGIVLKIS